MLKILIFFKYFYALLLLVTPLLFIFEYFSDSSTINMQIYCRALFTFMILFILTNYTISTYFLKH